MGPSTREVVQTPEHGRLELGTGNPHSSPPPQPTDGKELCVLRRHIVWRHARSLIGVETCSHVLRSRRERSGEPRPRGLGKPSRQGGAITKRRWDDSQGAALSARRGGLYAGSWAHGLWSSRIPIQFPANAVPLGERCHWRSVSFCAHVLSRQQPSHVISPPRPTTRGLLLASAPLSESQDSQESCSRSSSAGRRASGVGRSRRPSRPAAK